MSINISAFRLYLICAVFITLIAGPVYAAGGLECVNEDPIPDQNPLSPKPRTTLNPGFATPPGSDPVALTASIDTSYGSVRVQFSAVGEFPYGKPMIICHSSRDNRSYPAGIGRNHTYNIILLEHPDEWPLDAVRIIQANGYRISFDQDIDGNFRGQPGIHSRLIHLESGGYLLYTNGNENMTTDGDVCYCYGPPDTSGRCRLSYINDGGNITNFSYVASGPAAGELETVTEVSTSRTCSFNYNSQGKLVSVISLDNCTTGFTYNSTGDINTVTYSGGTLSFTYDTQHNICGINDGLAGHSASFTYSGSARGATFRDTLGNWWDFSYTTSSTDSVVSATFGPRGMTPSIYEFNSLHCPITTTIPGQPKMGHIFDADKQYLGSYEY